jgi:acetolactate synthase I/II/III large subunit
MPAPAASLAFVWASPVPAPMNFLPAMAAAQADKIPVLSLAGGIATYHEAQGAFQDGSNSGIDELTIVKPLLSAAIEVKNNLTLQHELRRSLSFLNTQRKGRTYLSVPVDMQKKEVAGGHEVSPPRTPQCREPPSTHRHWIRCWMTICCAG